MGHQSKSDSGAAFLVHHFGSKYVSLPTKLLYWSDGLVYYCIILLLDD